MIPTNNVVIQKAWVVSDIEQAMLDWSKAFNIGPFYLTEYKPELFAYVDYRGNPGKLHMKAAIAYSGDVQIELIQPVGSYPCCYFDTVKQGTNGFHHMCYWTDDMDADLKHYSDQGFEIANQGQIVGGGPRFAYVDAQDKLGCMIELLERRESTEQLFSKWCESAKNWTADQDVVIRL